MIKASEFVRHFLKMRSQECLILLISLTIYCLIEKFGLLVPRNNKFKHAFPSSAKVPLTSYIMMPSLPPVILCRAWKANCSDLLIENCRVKERVPRK